MVLIFQKKCSFHHNMADTKHLVAHTLGAVCKKKM